MNKNLSEDAYDNIRTDILSGKLLPNERLQIDAVSERYAIGAVPIREALNRLSAAGLVARRSNRGFCVSPISISRLEELVKTRIWLETLALSESIKNGDDDWEERLVVGYHRLARTQRRLPKDGCKEQSVQWEDNHKAFHMTLIERCESSGLLGFCSNLMEDAVRYRNLSMNRNPSKQRREGAAAEHKEILDAVLERETVNSCQLLEKHYRVTLDGLKTLDLPEALDLVRTD